MPSLSSVGCAPPDVGSAPRAGLNVEDVVSAVLASKGYRTLSPEFVERVARDACRHARRNQDGEKETKRRLHQVSGAYAQDLPIERFVSELEAAAGRPEALRETARRIMRAHASTRERLDVLDHFFAGVFALTGPPSSILDLACGFGPLALPWMALPATARYWAYDVDRRYLTLAETCFRVFDVAGTAMLCDVVAAPPLDEADVALVLKSVPCLEQQTPGSAARLLRAVRARTLVVSFPTRALGGASKGMVSTYRAMMGRLCAAQDWTIRELLFPAELVFIVDKNVA